MDVKLRKLERADIPLFYKWWNDDELRKWTSDTYEKMGEKEIEDILLKHFDDDNCNDFIIEFDGVPIGHILIQKDKNNVFSYYIAIGEKDYWDRRIGTKSNELAWKWFSSNFPGEVLSLEVNQDNPRAIRCYEKSGFKQIGEKKYKNKKPTFVMTTGKIPISKDK